MSKAKTRSPHPLDEIIPLPGRSRATPRAATPRAKPPRAKPPRAQPNRTATPPRSAAPARDDTWDATHERVTFHCPRDLLARIYDEVKERTKDIPPGRKAPGRTRVIVEILSRHYDIALSG